MIAMFWVRWFVRLLLTGAIVLAAGFAVAAPVGPSPSNADRGLVVRRFALITGASQGGAGRVPLRYAGTDARAMQHVLTELGGLSESGTILLLDVDRAGLRAGFDRLKQMVAAAASPGARTEIVFYYSGHSDETGLLLGADRVSYPEVRSWVEETGADVRIAVLDSCASGALTRGKGGVHRPPFLVDTSSAARGHAYLTASAENEAAQESDRLGAAYFTHYLVSGLRGAADVSHDGRVTLSEAYQYAFTETLARTETSRGGPQHASYDFQLAGKGDLVMTDLHATTASLQFPAEMSGRVYVRDAAGQLVAEVHKLAAQPIELGLPPGRYRVTLDDQRRLYETSVDLAAGRPTTLSPSQLVALVPAATVSRGPAAGLIANEPPPPSPPDRTINLSIYPGFDTDGGVLARDHFVFGFLARSASLDGLSLSLAHFADGHARGLQLGYLGAGAGGELRGLQIAGLAAAAGGPATGGQVGGLLAGTRGSTTGAQLAGIVCWAGGPLLGAQVAGLVTGARGGRGVELAGVGNVSDGDFRGAQISGVANLVPRLRGAQISGVFNGAEALDGVQIAVVNVGGDVRGAQIGVVNVARRAHGAQIGVVNVDDEMTGAPIGLVSVVGNGIHEAELAVSDIGAPVASAILGTKRVYTRLGIGAMAASNDIPGLRTDPTTGDERHYLLQWGFGGRFALDERFFVDVEGAATTYHRPSNFEQEHAVAGGLRLLVGVRLAPQLAFVLGPTYTASVGWSRTDLATGRDLGASTFHDGATTVRLFPGLVLGLRV